MAVTCEVEAPSAMAFGSGAQQLPLGGLPRSRDHRDDAKLLPQFSDGADNGRLGDFACPAPASVGKRWSRRLRAACRHGRQAAKPAAIRSAAGCDASRDRPAGHKHRAAPRRRPQNRAVRRAGPEVEPDRNSIIFKANKQILRKCDGLLIRGCLRPSGDGLHKRGRDGRSELPLRQKETKSRLFNPGAGFLQGQSSKAVLAHSFGARCSNCSDVKEKPHFRVGVAPWQSLIAHCGGCSHPCFILNAF